MAMTSSMVSSILKTNYLEIMKTFFAGMAFVTFGAIFAMNFLPYSIINIINILFLIFMVASVFILKQNIFKTKVSMNIYCFIMGIILSVTLLYYIGNLGSGIFISCVLGVGLIFGVSYLYALKSDEEDIFSMRPVLFKAMQVQCSNELLDEESIVIISLSLVTSFLNLLLHLLRLMMALKNND